MKKHLFQMLLLMAFAIPWATHAQSYCSPSPTSVDGSGITNVSFGEDPAVNNNQTPTSSPYYGNYSSQIGGVIRGDVANLSVTLSTGSWPYTISVWVDWDQDYTFSSSELVCSGDAPTGAATVALNFTVSATQALGNYRMRILAADPDYGPDATDPCPVSSSYCMVHDYTLQVVDMPDCSRPLGLTLASLTPTSFDVTWDAINGATYKWLYTIAGEDPDWTNATATENTVASVTTLEEQTSYVFYVRSICGAGVESNASSLAFTTPCASVVITGDLSYTEGFEGSALPCWTLGQYWSLGTGDYSSNTGSHTGAGNLKFSLSASSSVPYEALSPVFDNSTLDAFRLSFWYINRSWGGDISSLSVYYRTSASSEWVELTSITEAHAEWTQEQFDVDVASATLQLKFVAASNYGYGVGIDDIEISAVPDCREVTDLQVTSFLNDQATIAWTPGKPEDTQWEVQYREEGTDTWATTDVIDDNPTTLIDLAANTTYEVRVRTICNAGTDQSEWCNSITFHTDCDPVATLPLTENFDQATAYTYPSDAGSTFVECWRYINVGGVDAYANLPYVRASGIAHSGANNLAFFTGSLESGFPTEQIAVLPAIDVDANPMGNLRISFYAFTNNEDAEAVLQVGVMTDPNDATTFTQVAALSITGDYDFYSIPLSNYTGEGAYLAIRCPQFEGESVVGFFVDDVTVDVMPSCVEVTHITATEITSSSALISWRDDGNATSPNYYAVAYGPTNVFDLSDAETYEVMTTTDATATSLTIENLDAHTNYTFAARAVCSPSDISVWSATTQATTDPECATDLAIRRFAIGSHQGNSAYYPFYATTGDYAFGGSNIVFTPEELAENDVYEGSLTGIAFAYAGLQDITIPVRIYAALVDYGRTFSGLSDSTDRAEMTMVFEGDVTFHAGDAWTEIPFLTPLVYDGTSGIEFLVMRTAKQVPNNVSGYFYYTPSPAYAYHTLYRYGSTNAMSDYSYGYTGNRPDVRFTMCVSEPSCLVPLNLTASELTSSSVTLTWTNRSDAAEWQLRQGTGTPLSLTTADVVINGDQISYTVSGLSENNDYSFAVRSLCSEEDITDWTPALTIHTPCNIITLANGETYVEGVEEAEANSLPECWTVNVSGGAAKSTNYAHTGSASLQFKGQGNTVAVMPQIANINNMMITFYALSENSSYCGSLDFGYVVNGDASTFVALTSLAYNAYGSFTQVPTIYLNNIPANAQLAFRQTAANNYWWWIDDIEISAIPSCLPLASVTYAGAETNEAFFTVTHLSDARPQAYLVERTYNETTDTVSVVYNAQSMEVSNAGVEIVLTDLLANTAYSVRFASLCQVGDTSAWSSAYSFRTDCDVMAIPYTTSFESTDIPTGSYPMPFCWSRYNSTNGNYPYAASGNANSGYRSLYFYTSAGAAEMMAIAPELATNSLDGLRVNFYLRSTIALDSAVTVGTMSDPADYTTFTPLANINSLPSYRKIKLNLSGNNSYVAIRGNRPESGNASIYIDDFTIEVAPNCDLPEGFVTLLGQTSNSINLAWTNNSGAPTTTQWQIERTYLVGTESHCDSVVVSYADVTFGSVDNDSIYYTLTNLNAATAYSLRLRRICGAGDTSLWADNTASRTTQNNANDIVTFNIPTYQMDDAIIDNEAHTVTVPVDFWTNLSAVNGSFTMSAGATADTNGTAFPTTFSAVDFTTPITITVKAQDNRFTENWTVTLVPESCPRPESVEITNIDKYEIKIRIVPDSSGLAQSYDLVCSTEQLNAAALEDAQKVVCIITEEGDSSYTFTHLMRGTQYHIYVRTNCANANSGWIDLHARTIDLDECITVGTGTSSAYYFFPGLYGWQYAAYLYDAPQPGSLVSIAPYLNSGSTGTGATMQVWVKVVSGDFAFSSSTTFGEMIDGATEIYNGTGDFTSDNIGWINFPFETPMVVEAGQQILVLTRGVGCSSSGGCSRGDRYTSTANKMWYSRQDYSDPGMNTTGTVSSSRSDMQFCFHMDACPAPELASVELTGDGTTTANVMWAEAEGDFANTYDLYYVNAGTEVDLTQITPSVTGVQGLSYEITNLAPVTAYKVYVRVHCNADGYDDGYSEWSEPITFRTNSSCREVNNLEAEVVSKTAVNFTWENGTVEFGVPNQASNFQYGLSLSEMNENTMVLDAEGQVGNADGITAEAPYTNLTPGATYHFYVANDCGVSGIGPFAHIAVTMPGACQVPTNIRTTEVNKYDATIAWDADPYAEGDTYQYYLSDEAMDLDDLAALDAENLVTVTGTTANLTMLQRNTTYHLYIRTLCGDYGMSDWSEGFQFATAGLGSDCSVDGLNYTLYTGSESSKIPYVIWDNYYNNCYTQQIYTAEELTAAGFVAGDIRKVAFRYAYTSNRTATIALSMATTDQNAFESSSYLSNIPQVGSLSTTLTPNQWVEISLDETFHWDGASNIVIGTNVSSNWNGNSGANTFYGGNAGAYRTIYNSTDNSVSTTSGTRTQNRAHVRFTYCNQIPACPAIDDLEVSDVTDATATLTWTASTGDYASSYDIIVVPEEPYNESDLDDASLWESEWPSTTYSLTGLDPQTTYYVYVRANCAGDPDQENSVWSPAATFRTEGTCYRPSGFDYETVGAHQATLVWHRGNNTTTAWQIDTLAALDEYDVMATVTIDDVTIFGNGDSVRYTITGLDAQTVYELYVKSVCGEDVSEYDESIIFTTLNDAADITAFVVDYAYPQGSQMGDAVIDNDNHTVTITVQAGTDRSNLYQVWATTGSRVDYNGVEQQNSTTADFSAPRVYRVYAEDESIYQDWTVTVNYEVCASIGNLQVANVERVSATLNWFFGDPAVTTFAMVVSTTALDEEALGAATATNITATVDGTDYSYELTGLERGTEYHVYLRNTCSEDWNYISFTTHELSECAQVGNGTVTSTYQVPFSAYYHHSYTQQLYMADEINNNGTISALAFNYFWGTTTTRNITVYMGTTDATSLSSSWITPTDMTEVFHADNVTFDNTDNNWYTLTLDEPFEYTGGNVVVAMYMNYNSAETQYNGTYRFYNSSITGKARYTTDDTESPDQMTIANGVVSGSSGSSLGYRSNIKFCFAGEGCPAVTDAQVELTGDGATTATLTWTASEGDYATDYDVVLSTTPVDNFAAIDQSLYYSTNQTATSVIFSNLQPYTNYYTYIRANCTLDANHSDGSSTWVPVEFRTNAVCHTADNLEATLTGLNSVHISWTNDMESAAEYVLSTTAYDEAALNNATVVTMAAGSNELDLTTLSYSTHYYFYIRHNCGNNSVSPWTNTEFTTMASCPTVVDMQATPAFNAVDLSWQNGQYCEAEQWQITVTDAQNQSTVYTATSTNYIVAGLLPESDYTVSVQAMCSATDLSLAVSTTFTTPAVPSDCITMGNGTNSANLVYTGYGNSYSEHIYTAEELTQMGLTAGMISDLSFYFSASSASYDKKQSIYMGATTQSTFAGSTATDFVPASDMTLVYDPTTNTFQSGWRTFTLTTPFEWDGTSNIVIGFLSNQPDGADHTYSSGWDTYGTTTSPNYRSVCRYKDHSAVDPANLASTTTSGTRSYNRPNVQFCMAPEDCHSVRNLAVANVTNSSADITWHPGSTETEWNMVVSYTELGENDLATATATTVTSVSQTLTSLTVDADVYVYVQPVCGDELTGDWRAISFSTLPTCSQPLYAYASVENNVVTFSVTIDDEVVGTPESYEYEYWTIDGDGITTGTPVSGTTNMLEWSLGNLPTGAFYGWHVRANCGANDGYSRWTEGNNFYLCGTIVVTETNPYVEDFASDERLGCWTYGDNGEDEESATYTVWAANNSGNYFSPDGYYGPASLATPIISLPSTGLPILRFSEQNGSISYYTSGNGRNSVSIRRANGIETEIWSSGETVDALLNHHEIDLSEYLGQSIQVIFTYEGVDAHDWYVGNFSLAMEPHYAVSANVNPTGVGNVTITGSAAGNGAYYSIEPVVLTAQATATGYTFGNWTNANGDVIATTNPLSVNLTSDTILTANFVPATHVLTAYVYSGEASYGSVTLDGVAPAAGSSNVSATVEYASEHVLTAIPTSASYVFVNWVSTDGTITSTANPLTVTMPDNDLNIRAVFEPLPVERTSTETACDSWTLYKSNGTTPVRTFTQSGTYEVNYVDEDGAIHHTVNLTINYSTNSNVTETVCDSYTWTRGDNSVLQLETSNVYIYEYTNTANCPSHDTLTLTVNSSNEEYLSDPVEACDSYTYTFTNGTTYATPFTESNADATVTTTNVAGCDSTIHFALIVNASSTYEMTADACDSYSGEFFDQPFTSTDLGTNVHTFQGVNEALCDSTITLTLTIISNSDQTTDVTVCDSMLWREVWRTATGTYTDQVVAGACTSTLTLNLTVIPTTHEAVTDDVCDSYTWTRRDATTADYTTTPAEAVVYQWLATGSTDAVQCYNTDTLHLTVRHNSSTGVHTAACDSYTWTRGDATTADFSEAVNGLIYTYTNAENCPSADTLYLTIATGSHQHTIDATCGVYVWTANGQSYTASGRYYNNGTTTAGCLIRDTLDLTVLPLSHYTEEVTACDSTLWHGNMYYTSSTEAATYTVVNGGANGCDSIVTLSLTINNASHRSTTAVVCDSYTWSNGNGQTYTASTEATHNYTNAAQCASTDTLHLTVNLSTTGDTTAVECDSYTWRGHAYTASGNYNRTLSNAAHCDSVVTLHLTIAYSNTGDTTAVECDSYSWYGTTYTASATPTHTYTNIAGCDSVVTMTLTINNSRTATESATICGSYTWNGTTYTESGTQTYSTTGSNGCDSTVTLTLTIINAYSTEETMTACESYEWNGTTYTESGDVVSTLSSIEGCDSVVTLHLTINAATSSEETVMACDSYTWNGTVYTASTEATYNTQNAAGCDSVATLILTINYSAEDSVEVTLTDAELPYTYEGESYAAFGTYDVALATVAGCDSTVHLTLTRTEGIDDADLLSFVKVYPNPTTGRVQINAEQVLKVEVLDLVGREVARFENTATIDLTNLAAGTYTLRLTLPEGTVLRKVVKR